MSKYKKGLFRAIVTVDVLSTSLYSHKIKNMNNLWNGGRNPLHIASFRGYEDIMQIFLDKGMDVNYHSKLHGRTPLIEAVCGCGFNLSRQIHVIKMLLDHGADINAQDLMGYTASMHAMILNKIDIANTLLDLGSDINHVNLLGNTTIMTIVDSPNRHTLGTQMNLLLSRGVDVGRKYATGETILTKAYKRKLYENVHMLINHGADINTQNQDGKTLLMLAAIDNNANMVQYLLSGGADIDIRDNSGKNFVDHANSWYNETQ